MRSRHYAIWSTLVLLIPAGTFGRQSSDIRLDQIGFYPALPKIAIVRGAGDSPFFVINGSAGDTVFRGTLSSQRSWSYSGESVSKADFSGLTTPGRYFVSVPGVGNSGLFDIRLRVHDSVAAASLKGFYYQRASEQLTPPFAGTWARALGHPDTSVLIHPSAATALRPANSTISSPRGWYDAGDYNKYIVNSGISTYTILATYEHFPAYCSKLTTNIPESGNTIPDILDEALWNLRWMLSMQDPNDGGVYHKLTNANFDGWIMPAAATTTRYVVQKSTAATLDFAAVTAQAYRIFKDFAAALPGFADSCLQASFKAWNWARRNPAVYYNQTQMNNQYQPAITTGEYGDGYLPDELNWAAAELYVTTSQDSFLTVASPLNVSTASVPSWGDVNTLGLYTLAQHHSGDTTAVRSRIITLANSLRDTWAASPYGVVMGNSTYDFVWGSNGVAANQGMALLCAYQLTGDSSYFKAALANLDYLFGQNGTTYCFLTGFGAHSPMHIHHRPSQSDGIARPVPGLLAGGPNPGREDGVTTYPSTMPALCYTDDVNSYASNEICINWNAPLVFLAIGIEAIASPNGLPTGIPRRSKTNQLPRGPGMLQNYPNPFNPSTTIEYVLPHDGYVGLSIYNLLGQSVRSILNGWMSAGGHRASFSGADLPSGTYICRLTADGLSLSTKMILMK